MDPGVVLVIMVICGLIASGIASSKNRSGVGWFLGGALLNLVGILIVALMPAAPPPPPKGTRRVYCERCNALQNVPAKESSYECWQCKKTNKVASLKPPVEREK